MQKIAVLERKLQEAYDKLESDNAGSAATIVTAEEAKTITTLELGRVKEELARAREQTARLEEQLATAVETSGVHENAVGSLRAQLRKGATAATAECTANLEDKLRQSQRAVESTAEEIKSLKDGVAKYKAVAEAHEKSIAAFQDELDAVQGELQKARAQLNVGVSEHKHDEPRKKMEVSDSEVQRRVQRSARFSLPPTAPGAVNLKRSVPEAVTAMPRKMARLGQLTMESASLVDSQVAADEQAATASEAASD